MAERRIKTLIICPLPPPWAGVEQIGEMIIESQLKNEFQIENIKSNIQTSNAAKGNINFWSFIRFGIIVWKIGWKLILFRPAVVYLPISQNISGVLRDCMYILICSFFGASIIGHFHGSHLHIFLDSLTGLKKQFILVCLSKINHWIVLAHSIKHDLSKYISEEKMTVVYNACPDSMSIQNGHLKDPERIVISFMGHLSQAKGFWEVVDVAKKLIKNNPKLIFQFAGEPILKEKNISGLSSVDEAKIRWNDFLDIQRKFPDQIRHVGIVTGHKKAQFFKKSDIFVFPSYAESFGIAAFEAMKAGLPVVVTPVGALKELLESEKNCFFVTPGDKNALESSILKLIQNPQTRANMARNNKELSQKFTVAKMTQEIGQIIKNEYKKRN